jgi:hypothetical protein
MKKMLALLLVGAMSTMVSATVIQIETYDIGNSSGNLGTNNGADALAIGDSVGVRVRMLFKDYGATYPSYDGYVTDAFGVSIDNLDVTGSGTLSALVGSTDKSGNPSSYDITFNSGFDAATKYAATAATNPVDGSGNVPVLSGTASNIVSSNGVTDGVILVSGLILTADAAGYLTLDMTGDSGRYFDYQNGGGTAGYVNAGLGFGSTSFASDASSVGDANVYIVPEPMTMTLLGLGGLVAARRRRA